MVVKPLFIITKAKEVSRGQIADNGKRGDYRDFLRCLVSHLCSATQYDTDDLPLQAQKRQCLIVKL